jgi:hypothetical protein
MSGATGARADGRDRRPGYMRSGNRVRLRTPTVSVMAGDADVPGAGRAFRGTPVIDGWASGTVCCTVLRPELAIMNSWVR